MSLKCSFFWYFIHCNFSFCNGMGCWGSLRYCLLLSYLWKIFVAYSIFHSLLLTTRIVFYLQPGMLLFFLHLQIFYWIIIKIFAYDLIHYIFYKLTKRPREILIIPDISSYIISTKTLQMNPTYTPEHHPKKIQRHIQRF